MILGACAREERERSRGSPPIRRVLGAAEIVLSAAVLVLGTAEIVLSAAVLVIVLVLGTPDTTLLGRVAGEGNEPAGRITGEGNEPAGRVDRVIG